MGKEVERRNAELECEVTGLRNSYWTERKARLAAEAQVEAMRKALEDILADSLAQSSTEEIARAALSAPAEESSLQKMQSAPAEESSEQVGWRPSREAIAREAALHGIGRIDGMGNREPPNEKWTQGEWERRILECVPGAVELQCYALADAILALSGGER